MSLYRFEGEAGETIDVGWDEVFGTFFAWVTPAGAGAEEIADGLAAMEVVDATPFGILGGEDLAGRLERRGIAVPDGIQKNLAIDDASARTIETDLEAERPHGVQAPLGGRHRRPGYDQLGPGEGVP
jgi:hypothetical protein